ncbi:YgfZ/GcvT domain-containing protein [Pelagibacterium montanilacus]|uniref:CAF17-like 4Fe-4S cluster assembly/insertion protein YgfZ n=1 Tax=Pelagibacterium montanilacus TaxID=2185280 RepID=UPI000F8F1136|nr:folate-binding protein YgfZ [Pelagibacterium montanilacus]
MTIELRSERVAFRISGPDATHLLNDVLTPSITEGDAVARWFALLSPQGKLLAEGLIGWADDGWWLDVHESVAENFRKRMTMYRLRAKLEIAVLAETHRVGWSAERPEAGIVHADGRDEGLGYRVIAEREAAGGWAAGDGAHKARIALGIPELGPDFGAEEVFPHDIGMDHLGGVDFKKGCYVGQEVVSRMQHRGTARRRPVIVGGLTDAAAGDGVVASGKAAGQIGRVIGGSAVGLVRIDRIADPESVEVGGRPATLALPGWARYALGQPGGDSQ